MSDELLAESDEAAAVRAMPCLACEVHIRRAAFIGVQAHAFAAVNAGKAQAAHVTPLGKGGPCDLAPLCQAHLAEAGEPGTAEWYAFEERYGLGLRAEADRIALAHEPPLGIRGLAGRWAWHYLADDDWSDVGLTPLDAYESGALLGWVSRRMAAYAAGAASQGLTWTNDPAGRDDMVEWLGQDLPELSADLVRSLCDAAGWPC